MFSLKVQNMRYENALQSAATTSSTYSVPVNNQIPSSFPNASRSSVLPNPNTYTPPPAYPSSMTPPTYPQNSSNTAIPVHNSSEQETAPFSSNSDIYRMSIAPGLALTDDLYRNNFSNDRTQVKSLQQFLIAKGYMLSGNDTGYFGPMTQQSLISFQQAHNITPALGYLGSKTRQEIVNTINEAGRQVATCDCTDINNHGGVRRSNGTCESNDCLGGPK